MKQLFCDCKTDEEKANFFLSGRAVETGIIAPAISNDVSMAYHRCAEFQKEIDTLRAKVAEMEQQEPVGTAMLCVQCSTPFDGEYYCPTCGHHTATEETVYALPGAQTQPAPSVPEGWEKELFCIQHAMAMNNWNWDSDASNDMKRAAYAAVVKLLAVAPEAKP